VARADEVSAPIDSGCPWNPGWTACTRPSSAVIPAAHNLTTIRERGRSP